jgi:hypothetical protein
MFPVVYGEGFSILDDFFEQSFVDTGPSSAAGGLEKGPETELLGFTAVSSIPGATSAFQPPSTAALDAVPLESPDILNADFKLADVATLRTDCSTEESDSTSLSTGLTSCTPPEGGSVNGELHTRAQQAVRIKRSVLDWRAPSLEHVLVALDINDTSRQADSSIPGVLDDIVAKGDLTLCVKIMTSIVENYVKCNRCISRPTFDQSQGGYSYTQRQTRRLHTQRPAL